MKTKQPKALTGYERALLARQQLSAHKKQKVASKQPKISQKITGEKPIEKTPFIENIATCNKKVLGAVSLQESQTRHQPSTTTGISLILPNKYKARLQTVKFTISGLPPEIDNLIDSKYYRCLVVNRLNQVGLQQMMLLVETARNCATKSPNRYFMKCLSKKKWEKQTKPMLTALRKLQEKTKKTLSKLGISEEDAYFFWFVKALKVLPEAKIQQALERAQDQYFRQPRLKFVKELSKAIT